MSPEFIRAFKERCAADGTLRFDAFVDLALYHPEIGYYRRDRQRVGYGAGTDFFTASTSGPVFGEMIVAACVKLLGPHDPMGYTFVEIGAEKPGGVLHDVQHPFRAVRNVRIGDTLDLSGPCVVFSNELFDAQPFRRVRFERDRWMELGVQLHGDQLHEVALGECRSLLAGEPAELGSSRGAQDTLPPTAPEGYTIDLPIAAATLARIIARQSWTGLFLAFDYGKSWQELVLAQPAGTARAYFRHTQTNDLLARPGEQDLTCHVCWDWIESSLAEAGFRDLRLDTQESFFIHHAEAYLAPAIAADAGRLTPRKQSLLQLLHGSHLGQKFQVLSGRREQGGTA